MTFKVGDIVTVWGFFKNSENDVGYSGQCGEIIELPDDYENGLYYVEINDKELNAKAAMDDGIWLFLKSEMELVKAAEQKVH